MDRIRKLAELSVLRGVGFASLAIGVAMAGMLFDPVLAFRMGAVLMLILAVIMEGKVRTYPYKRRITETEVWQMLEEAERPAQPEARRLITAAMQAELREKAGWALIAAGVFFVVSLGFRWLG